MTIKVDGITQLRADLHVLGASMEDMKDAMSKIAHMGAAIAVAYAPKRTGALAQSIRGNRAYSKATVAAGRGRSREYAGVINYGSPKRGIAASRFMQRASDELSPKLMPLLTAEINRLIRERGLK